jgi:hypothetical protein
MKNIFFLDVCYPEVYIFLGITPLFVNYRHEMSVKGDFCDNFSTTLSITLNKVHVSLESMCQRRQYPMTILT